MNAVLSEGPLQLRRELIFVDLPALLQGNVNKVYASNDKNETTTTTTTNNEKIKNNHSDKQDVTYQ